MSFREKTAWIGIVSLLGLIVWYFWPFVHAGQHGSGFSFLRLAIAVAVIMIMQTVVRMVVAAFTPKEEKTPPDEREKMIETKSKRFAYAVLAWAVRCALFFGIFNPTIVFSPNTLLFFLLISEVLGTGYQIVLLRRGA
jgi:uncharacterized membrane protein